VSPNKGLKAKSTNSKMGFNSMKHDEIEDRQHLPQTMKIQLLAAVAALS